jgi:hypothetical protein
MRRFLPVLLLLPALALAQSAPAQLKIQIGKSKSLKLGGPVGIGTCDDKSIVRVEAGDAALTLTGVKVGKTSCGFWKQTEPGGAHTVVEVVVTEEDPDAPAKK